MLLKNKYGQLHKAKDFLLSKEIVTTTTGIVLGTGLHQLIDCVDVKQTISYADIPGFTLIGKTICCIM